MRKIALGLVCSLTLAACSVRPAASVAKSSSENSDENFLQLSEETLKILGAIDKEAIKPTKTEVITDPEIIQNSAMYVLARHQECENQDNPNNFEDADPRKGLVVAGNQIRICDRGPGFFFVGTHTVGEKNNGIDEYLQEELYMQDNRTAVGLLVFTNDPKTGILVTYTEIELEAEEHVVMEKPIQYKIVRAERQIWKL